MCSFTFRVTTAADYATAPAQHRMIALEGREHVYVIVRKYLYTHGGAALDIFQSLHQWRIQRITTAVTPSISVYKVNGRIHFNVNYLFTSSYSNTRPPDLKAQNTCILYVFRYTNHIYF